MSNVVVYVFLLDNLAGFKNALNETVIKNTPSLYSNYTPVLRQCDAGTTNQILNAVTKELETEIMPSIKFGEKFALSTNDELNDVSQDILYNAVLASSLPVVDGGDEFFARAEDFENDSNEKYRRTFSFENEENIRNIIEVKNNKNKTNFAGKDERLKGNTKNYTQDDHKENANHYIEEYKHKLNTNNYIQENEHKLNTNNYIQENEHKLNTNNYIQENEHKLNTNNYIQENEHKLNTNNYIQENEHKLNTNNYIQENEHKLNTNNYIQENEHKLNTNNYIQENEHKLNTNNYIQENEHKLNTNNYIQENEHKLNTNNYIQENEHKLNTNNFTEENDLTELPHDISEINIHRVNTSDIVEDSRNATTIEVDFPRDALFLVAIFETLGNITAQTCAGTLVAPNWVLTGANCVNILSNLYANDTNMTDSETLYTVVAGAMDPLSDGSAHNVTAVLQHQGFSENSTRNRKSVHVEIGPFLAMMKIEPEFEGVELPVVQEKVKKGDVMIYGWILTKNDSGLDTLNLVIMTALILSTAECQAMYSFNNNDVICLFNNDKETNITQLSSGGPVLILHGGEVKLLAVAQTDEHVFIAYPLYVHYDWIKTILNSNL